MIIPEAERERQEERTRDRDRESVGAEKRKDNKHSKKERKMESHTGESYNVKARGVTR